ncbi:MAG: hypothetical protein D6681_16275, partial [Calditrichaeota bacterium]
AGLRLYLSTGARSLEERRSFPVFNRFDDIVQQGIYALNDNWFLDLQGGVQLNLDIAGFPYLKSVAAGVYEEVNLDYRYDEEVRSNDFDREQVVLAYNKIRFDGGLRRYAVGVGLQFAGRLNLGLQAGFLSGDLQQERSITFVGAEGQDVRETGTHSLQNTPVVLSAGAIYEATPHLSLGAYVRLPYTVEYRFTGTTVSEPVAESIEYPLQLTGGLEYRSRQELQARLNIDVTYEWWSQTQSAFVADYLSPPFEDAIRVKAGIEHIFHNKIPFRVGLQYRTTFQDRQRTRTLITAGTGFRDHRWQIDVAGGFSKLTYPFPDLFDDRLFGGDRSRSNIDDVSERYFFGRVTLRVHVR